MMADEVRAAVREFREFGLDFSIYMKDGAPAIRVEIADNEIEREGVRKTEKLLKKADFILYLHDAGDAASLSDISLNGKQNHIILLSRCDLAKNIQSPEGVLLISSKTGTGIDSLISELTKRAESLLKTGSNDSLVMVERHRIEIKHARNSLKNALLSVDTWSEEIISLELSEAQDHLEAVIGQNIDIDVLDEIFKNFCVGK